MMRHHVHAAQDSPGGRGRSIGWLLVLLCSLMMSSLSAATCTWSGGGGDNNWTTAANWDAVPVGGEDLVFAGTTRLTPNNDFAADTSFASVTFNSGSGVFVIGGNRITLAGSVTNSSASTQTITLAMIMAATRTMSAASGELIISGILSGAGGLTKTGVGTVTLSGVNVFTGATTVSAGTLSVTGSTDAGSAVTVSSGATLAGTGTIAGTVAVADGGTLAPGVGASPVASFVASDLRAVTQDDWRATQTITGTRTDQIISQPGNAFGSAGERAAYGIGGNDGDWDNFSVQWDGYLRVVTAGATLSTRSDDGSRVWLDLNNNGVIDSGEWGSNGWGSGQGETTRTVHASLAVGLYRMRVQYEEGNGGNAIYLLWDDAANSAGTVAGLYLVPSTLVVGSTIGTLTTGAVTFNGTSTYTVDLNGTTPTFDQVSTAGSVACAGTLTVNAITNAAVGKVYTIINAASVTGTFSGLADGAMFVRLGRIFRVNYSGTTVTLTDVAHPTTRTWDGGGADNNWSTAANWDSDIAPVAGDDLQFGGTTRLSPINDFPVDTSFASITFLSGAGAFVLGSNGSTPGTISRDVWTGVGGTNVASIPVGTAPNISDTLSSMETLTDWADNYGTRIRGFITAPTTGNYTFWVASDDDSELWLSTDAQSANKVLIGSVSGWTGSREWGKYGSQKSSAIALAAGQKYYVEVLQKEGGGGDNLAVGWAKPGESTAAPSEVIPGAQLSPYANGYEITLAGNITNSSGNLQTVNLGLLMAATRTVNCASADVVVGGVFSGSGGLTKTGGNMLTLTGANTYAGVTTISAGTLQIGNGTTDGSIAASSSITDNAALIFNVIGARTYGNVISGTGTLTKTGVGTLTLSGASTYTGASTINGGTLLVTGSTAAGSAMAVNSGATLAGTGTVAGTVTVANGGKIAPGFGGALVASFVATSLRAVTQDDWRATQTIAGTRTDQIVSQSAAFGTAAERAANGIGGNDGDWDNFSVQWDGYVRVVTAGTTLSTRSDDGSRVWLDLNNNGVIDSGEWGSNNWGGGQGETTRTVHASLPVGIYRMRVQYEEGGGGNAMYLLWDDAANSAGTVAGLYVVPANLMSPIGTLATGAVTMNGTSTYEVDLNGTTPTYDQINSSGAVACAGTLTIASVANMAIGKAFVIVNAASVSGTFTGLATGTIFVQQGRYFRIDYTGTTVTLNDVARPTTRIWDGGGTDNNWTTAANWDFDIVPIAGDDVQFAGTTRLTPNNDFAADTSFASITFNSGAGAFVIGGNRITLTGDVTNNDDSVQTINHALLATATRTYNAASGAIAIGGIISGAGGLTKAGAGALTLSGANDFSGGVSLNSGTLNLNHATALGTVAGAFVIAAGTTIDNTSGGLITLTANNAQTWNGDFTFTGSNTLNLGAGAVAMGGATRQVTVSATTLTVGGAISGAGGLTKAGAGTLALSGTNTYSGATTVAAGTLRVGVDPALPGTPAALYTFDNVSGATVINDGSLGAGKDGTLVGATVTGGGFTGNALTIVGANDQMQINTSGVDLSGGNWTASAWFKNLKPASSWRTLFRGFDHHIIIEDGTYRLGVYDNSGGGQFRPSGYDVAAGNVQTGWHHVAAVGSGSTTRMFIDGVFVGAADRKAVDYIFAVGNFQSGPQPFADRLDNVYIYQSALSDGQVAQLYAATGGPLASTVIPDTSAVTVAGGATLDLSHAIESIGSLAGAGNVTLGTGSLTAGGDNTSTTFSGAITATIDRGFTKTGTGTLTLSGSSTYTGATTVGAGTLLITGSTGASAVSVSSGATVGGSGTVGGVITLAAGSTLSPGTGGTPIAALTAAGIVCNATSVFAVDLNGTTPTYDQIASSGTVACAGTLTVASLTNAGVGKTYVIVSAASVTGTFSGLANGTIFIQQGRLFQISYTGTTVTLTDVVRPTVRVWDGGSLVDNNWTTAANWDYDLAPQAGDVLHFAGTTRLTPVNDFAADTIFAGITFDTGAGTFSISGNRVALSGAITNNDDSLQTIACDINPLWRPSQIAAAGWYDASDAATITHSSGAVSQWNDKSGNALHMMQGSALLRPTTALDTIGGLNALRFGGAHYLATASNPFGATINDAFVIVVLNRRTISNSTLFTLSGSDAGGNRWQAHAPWGDGNTYFDTGGFSPPNRVNASSGWSAASDHLFSVYGSTTDNVQQVHADGSLLVGDATGHAVSTVGNIVLGSELTNYDNVDIGECIIINGTVTAANRQALEGYLANKWGLTALLPGGHPYKTIAPGMTLSLVATSGDLLLSGAITGTGGLAKSGTGKATLSSTGTTYTGATSITAGTLALNQTTGYASATTTVTAPGVLELTSTNTTVDNWRLNTLLTGGGTITKTGSGWIQTFTNAHTFSGVIDIQVGTFGTSYLTSDWSGITADVTVASGALLDPRGQAITIGSLSGAGTVGTTWNTAATVNVGAANKSGSFSGVISGDASSATNLTANPNAGVLSLVKVGSGTQTLGGTAANTYSGVTTITDGILVLQKTAGVNAIAGNIAIGDANGSDILRLGSDNQIADTSIITFTSGGAGNSAKLELNGYLETVAGIQSNANQASVIQETESGGAAGPATPSILTVNNSADFVYDGLIRNVGAGGGSVGLAKSGAGTLTLRCGFSPAAITYTGATTLSAGKLVIDNLSGFSSAITENSAAADALTFNQTSQNLTYGAAISGSGVVTKTGAATLTLSGTNTYVGATTVSAGALFVTGSTAAGSAVTVSSGSTLGGTGTVAGTITVADGGTLAPGTGGTTIGTLSTGSVICNATSTYAVDLDGTTPTFDRINTAGTVTCAGTLTLASLANAAIGKVYTIVSAGTVSSTFSGLANNAVFVYSGRLFRITYSATTVTLTDVAPVLTGRQTLDVDGDGQIDRIRLTFNLPLNDNTGDLMVTVAGYVVTGFSSGTANDNVLDVLLTESGSGDTGATPLVQITVNTLLMHSSGTGVVQVEGSGTVPTDSAKPVLLSSLWTDGDANGVDVGDTVTLTFSEPVATSGLVFGDLGLPVASDSLGGNAATATADQSGSATISFALSTAPALSPGDTYSSLVLGANKPSGIFLAVATHVADLAAAPNLAAIGNAASAVDVGAMPSTLIRIEWNDTNDTIAKTWALGAIDLSSVSASATYTILNAGHSSVSLSATSSDSAAWTVQPAVGSDAFAMKANADVNPDFELTLSTVAVPIPTSLRSGSLFDFSLQFSAPSNASTSASQTVVVTITASQY